MDKVNMMPDDQEESLDDLVLGGMKLFQSREGYRFSLDAILLAHFPVLDGIKQAVGSGHRKRSYCSVAGLPCSLFASDLYR